MGNPRKTGLKTIKSHVFHSENFLGERAYKSKLKYDDPKQQREYEYLFALLISLATMAIYVKTLHPSLPGGDSGELVIAAHELGVAHPPGYPLFTLLSFLMLHTIRFGSPVWKVNILSSAFGAIASGIIFIVINRLCKSNAAGILGAFVFALSRLVWTWSGSAEVFSLNNLLLAMLMVAAVEFDIQDEKHKTKISYFGSFLCGLCLSNQHTSILYIVFLVPWVIQRLWENKHLHSGVFLRLTVWFVLGLSPYLYLPISSVANMARWTWGDQSSVTGFLKHLLRQEYGTWDLLRDHAGQGFIHGLQSYLTHIVTDLSIPVSSLAALSMWITYHRYKSSGNTVLVVFTAMLFGYIAFFCWRVNLDIDDPLFFKVVERFWMQSDMVLVVLASVTFADVCRLLSHRLNLPKNCLDCLLMFPLLGWQLHRSLPLSDNSSNTVVRDFALQSLAAFPNNSIILTKGDLPSNSFRYFHFCEGVRPDLSIFDQEVLTYRWSLSMTRKFYPGINFPGDFLHLKRGVVSNGEKSFTFLDLIDENYHRPIFACIGVQEYESTWKKNYDIWPYSVCWMFKKKEERLELGEWVKRTENLAYYWHYAHNSLEPGSWESVANGEMWRAKTATAMFYLDVAFTLPEDSDENFILLKYSYQVLSRAMKQASQLSPTNSTDDVPAYWHRNFAIVCDRLVHRVGTNQKEKDSLPDQRTLIKLTAHHFRQFLRLDPQDPDYSKIKEAVDTLQKYIDTVT